MATLIHGIGSSEHLDSSGERISIKGLDISSLPIDGTFTWEHKNDSPTQVVGKILEAKKIFSETDCDNPRQLYFWNKIQVPYLYVMGELFDDVGHDGAKQIAAMLRYDVKNKGKNQKNIINFSVEGSKLDSQGSDIVKSIARKVTLTILACNKMAIAEQLDPKDLEKNAQSNSLLKSEVGAELLEKADYIGAATKNRSGLWGMDSSKQEPTKEAVKAPTKPVEEPPKTAAKGVSIAKTKSGKDIYAHTHPKDYADFSSKDHSDAMNAHYDAALNATIPKLKNHYLKLSKLHSSFRNKQESVESRSVKKADVAPSNRINGDALMKEKIEGIYSAFDNKDKLLSSIKAKHPNLNKHEILALAKIVVYNQEMSLEKSLKKIKA
jgi:hypothetical protein